MRGRRWDEALWRRGRVVAGVTTRGCVDASVTLRGCVEARVTTRGCVDAGVTSYGCAASASAYSGFNMCHYTGDDPVHVARCRDEFVRYMGIRAEALVIPRQTHSINVAVIDRIPVAESQLEGVDALVTRMTDVVIGVSTADCVPCVLADDAAGVIAVAHAGWRGAVAGIVGRTIDAMLSCGATRQGIRALIGPCICADCFEVGEEVASRFPEEFVLRRDDWARPHVDLPAYVCSAITGEGVPMTNVERCDIGRCTRCHPERYFSARALGIASGRCFTYALLRP